MDLKLGRLSWITQVDLTYSHASLKAEKFFPMGGKKDAGKDVRESPNMRRIQCTVAGIEL